MKRSLFPICILMALLIIVISMTSISYSWFEPGEKAGIGLEFKDTTKLRAQNCTLQTFEGTMGNKVVSYSNTPVSSGNVKVEASGSGENITPGIMYYKTVITNSSKDYDSVVSLFLPSFKPSAGSASLCVAVPTNSVRTFSAEQMDLHIIRNAYVPKLVATDVNPGQLIVEWFVKCESGSVTFNPSQVYLMYS